MSDTDRVGQLRAKIHALAQSLQRDPSAQEIADLMQWPLATVKKHLFCAPSDDFEATSDTERQVLGEALAEIEAGAQKFRGFVSFSVSWEEAETEGEEEEEEEGEEECEDDQGTEVKAKSKAKAESAPKRQAKQKAKAKAKAKAAVKKAAVKPKADAKAKVDAKSKSRAKKNRLRFK